MVELDPFALIEHKLIIASIGVTEEYGRPDIDFGVGANPFTNLDIFPTYIIWFAC